MTTPAPRRAHRGYTLVELTVALVIGLFVVLVLGRIVLSSQSSWRSGHDKAVLQQNTTEALEWMARSIRAARTIAVVDSTEFSTYDETGALVHTYRAALVGGQYRLQEDGINLVDRVCTRFRCDADDDTTSLTITVEFEDSYGFRVGGKTRAAIRNQSFEF